MNKTNNQTNEINQIKGELNSPVITSITFWDKDNYVDFSNTDSQTDYFNSYSLGINHLMEEFWSKRYGATIRIDFGNNEMDVPKYYKRLEKLVKATGYKLKTINHKGISRLWELRDRCDINPYNYDTFVLYDPHLIKEEEIIVK
jgi:hypothetical protein